jgi:hypothetical protein
LLLTLGFVTLLSTTVTVGVPVTAAAECVTYAEFPLADPKDQPPPLQPAHDTLPKVAPVNVAPLEVPVFTHPLNDDGESQISNFIEPSGCPEVASVNSAVYVLVCVPGAPAELVKVTLRFVSCPAA